MNKLKRKFKREKKFKKIYFTFEFIFQMFLYLGFGSFIFYALIFELVNFKNNTFGLTNYGFTIMLGFSAISFSWASVLRKKEKTENIR